MSSKDLVFVHLHKSGGSFIKKALRLNQPDDFKKLGYHTPSKFIPHDLKNLPVVGCVRNPMAYYISFFTFQSRMLRKNFVWKTFSNNGSLNALETIKRMASPTTEMFDKMIDLAPIIRRDKGGVNLSKECVEELSSLSGGFYTRMFKRLYGDIPSYYIRTENIPEDMKSCLNSIGVPVSQELEKILNENKPINNTTHKSYQDIYDDELIQMITENDQYLIEKFNY